MSDRPEHPVTAEIVSEPTAGRAESVPGLASVKTEREQPPLGVREIVAVLALVVLCDLTIYRGQGSAGYALLFVAAPALLLFGSFRPLDGGRKSKPSERFPMAVLISRTCSS